MAFLQLFILSSVLITTWGQDTFTPNDEGYDYRGYRLNDIYSPFLYDIYLFVFEEVFNGTSTSFNGTVNIAFQVTEETNSIQIHSQVNISSIALYDSSQTSVNILNSTHNETTSVLVIDLASTLLNGTNYYLLIDYVGTLSTKTMLGFYLSRFEDANGVTQYLVTTQFESPHARKAFPCFDEPHFKAQFDISITYPKGLNALGNTPQLGNATEFDATYETATFERTPIMSTYLIAFIVSSFTCSSGENIDVNVPHRVCSRNDTQSDRALANQFGPQLMQTLENITAIKYSEMNIGKMDQVAIPDFDAGAMENWGLVTYREASLLWNSEESTNINKQRIVSVIAHEFAHMWFGDLITMNWWNNTFLNEGFARFFQYFAPAQILADWEMDKQFIIEQQHSAFVVDGTNTSKSLTSNVATPDEISAKFNSISYNKGACVFRMIENIIGHDNFISALRTYLRTNANSTTKAEDIVNAFAATTPSQVLPNVSLASVLDNWFNAPGYPIVKVTLNGNNIILSQKRYLVNGNSSTQWYIPISYTVSTNISTFSSVAASHWLMPQNNLILNNVVTNNGWIILNNQESAYYRVNYDNILWSRIKQALFENHTQIHILNRAQIVDDVCNLALAAEISYTEALGILEYLRNETEYYPWYPAISCFNQIASRFGTSSEIGIRLDSLQNDLIKKVYQTVSFSNLNETDQIYTLKLSTILLRACKIGDQTCVDSAKDIFQKSKNGTRIDKNLKTVVYCTALRYSDNIQEDWLHLWNVYRNTTISTLKVVILSVLGCTKDVTYLNDALEQSINSSSGIRIQDIATVWSSVYTSNSEGTDVALEFFSNNHQRISQYYSAADSLLTGIAARISTTAQLEKLDQLRLSGNLTTTLQATANKSAEVARTNIAWSERRRYEFEEYFGITSTSTSTESPHPDGATENIAKMSTFTVLFIVLCQLVMK